jgi:hypothetical protein
MTTTTTNTEPTYYADANWNLHFNRAALELAITADDTGLINYTLADVVAWRSQSREQVKLRMNAMSHLFEVLTRCEQAEAYLIRSTKLVPIVKRGPKDNENYTWALASLVSIVGCAEVLHGSAYPYRIILTD